MHKDRSNPLSLQEILDGWLQLRVEALQNMLWVLDLSDRYGSEATVEINIGKEPTIHSTLPLLSNPIITSGYVHARAILEFLGIAVSDGSLVEIRRRRKTDVAIEHYSLDGVYLKKISLDEIYEVINLPRAATEWALVAIVESANKLHAHVTRGEVLVMAMDIQIRVAIDGILILLNNYLFAKLNRSEEIVVNKGTTYSCNSCNRDCPTKSALDTKSQSNIIELSA